MKLSGEGVDNLKAGVLRNAYMELLEARLADAAYRERDTSYNCHLFYQFLNVGRAKYAVKKNGEYHSRKDIVKLESWFLSGACKVWCKNVDGSEFVRIAKIKAREFADDVSPVWQVRPSFEGSGNHPSKYQKKTNYSEWVRDRDAWRKEHGLKGVGSGKSN